MGHGLKRKRGTGFAGEGRAGWRRRVRSWSVSGGIDGASWFVECLG